MKNNEHILIIRGREVALLRVLELIPGSHIW